jgi:uncharacterized protein (TIGR02588 family)
VRTRVPGDRAKSSREPRSGATSRNDAGSRNGTDQERQGDAVEGRQDGGSKPAESRLQLLVTWLSGLLLLVAVGYLILEGMREYRPASFSHRFESVREAAGRYYLPLRVTNTGGESVQGLVISIELRSGPEVIETSTANLDWLPEGSTRRVVMVFEEDPAAYRPVVDYEGYQLP